MQVTASNDGVTFLPFPKHGCYFGVATYNGKPCLLSVAMMQDGGPALIGDDDDLNVVEVSCIGDGDDCLEAVNAEFGTTFTRADFFGR